MRRICAWCGAEFEGSHTERFCCDYHHDIHKRQSQMAKRNAARRKLASDDKRKEFIRKVLNGGIEVKSEWRGRPAAGGKARWMQPISKKRRGLK